MANSLVQAKDRQITVVGRLKPTEGGHADGVLPIYSEVKGSVDDETFPVARVDSTRMTMGRYHVLKRLGEGGMGVVYHAYDPELERPIALKVVRTAPNKVALDADARHECQVRMIREARSLARLMHPNIVSIYDVGIVDDQDVFLAMELVAGKDLATVLKEKRFTQDEILDLFLEAGEGLAAAHRVGIVHRDFKTENCVLGNDGRVRVLDFGLALADPDAATPSDPLLQGFSSPSNSSLARWSQRSGRRKPDPESRSDTTGSLAKITDEGVVVGTPRYMAPEQALGQQVTAQCDVFSFCLCLYESICKTYPFSTKSRKSRLQSIARGKLSWPAKVPKWLRAAITAGLAYNPKKRPENLAALLCVIRSERGAARARRHLLRNSALASLVVGALASAWTAMGESSGHAIVDCDVQANQIDAVWSPSRSDALAAAFARASEQTGPSLWQSVDRRVSEWVADWRAAKLVQCLASFPEARAQSIHGDELTVREHLASAGRASVVGAADAELARLCLEQRFAQLEALVEGWRVIDAASLPGVVAVAEKLDAPDLCLDSKEVRAIAPLPEDPKVRAQVQRLRVELGKLAMAQAQTRYDEVRRKLDSIRDGIIALGDQALLADLYSFLERAYYSRQSYGVAEEAYDRGIQHALRAGHWRAAAWLRLQEIYHRHYQLRDPSFETESALRDAASWSRAGGAPPYLESRLARTRGIIFSIQGRFEQALPFFRESLAHARAASSGDSVLVAVALDDLAIILQYLGHGSEARTAGEESLRMRLAIFGWAHPEVARAHMGLSHSMSQLGDGETSVRFAVEALHSCLGTGVGDKECGEFIRLVGDASQAIGDFERAQGAWLRLLDLGLSRIELGVPDDVPVATKYSNTVDSRGIVADAITLARLGTEEEDARSDLPAIPTARSIETLAYALAEGGKAEEAQQTINRAVALMRKIDVQQAASIKARFDAHAALVRGAANEALMAYEDAIRLENDSIPIFRSDPAYDTEFQSRLFFALGDYDAAQYHAQRRLALMHEQVGLQSHVYVSAYSQLARTLVANGRPYEALDEIRRARDAFNPAQMLDNRLARVDFIEAQARWMIDESIEGREYARSLAQSALARFQDWDLGAARDIDEVRLWLQRHRIARGPHT
jgi:tetratricopeptide (TPR) repeat protein